LVSARWEVLQSPEKISLDFSRKVCHTENGTDYDKSVVKTQINPFEGCRPHYLSETLRPGHSGESETDSETGGEMTDTIKPSDLRTEAERLIKAGKMPPLDKLLGAVSDAREKYRPQIDKLRQSEKSSPESKKVNPFS
jgi:hypothetical protein